VVLEAALFELEGLPVLSLDGVVKKIDVVRVPENNFIQEEKKNDGRCASARRVGQSVHTQEVPSDHG